MALEAEIQELTMPGSTGNQTYNFSNVPNPKLILGFATPLTSAGTAAGANICAGMATYRGSVVQQRVTGVLSEDAVGTSDTYRQQTTGAFLRLLEPTGTTDLEVDLVSMTAGTPGQVVLNWVNLYTTASIKVTLIALGGSYMTDALVDGVNVTGTTHDETVVASFGKPDLIIAMCCLGLSTNQIANSSWWSYGFTKKGEAGRSITFHSDSGEATAQDAMTNTHNDKIIALYAANQGNAQLTNIDTAEGNWPTDGFEIDTNISALDTEQVAYAAVRFTSDVVITTGNNTTPTSTGQRTMAAGGTPKFALTIHSRQSTSVGTMDTSGTGVAMVGFGATDGTNEAWHGIMDDDNVATSVTDSGYTNGKSFRSYTPGTPTLESEADGSFSGSDFILDFTDADGAEYPFQWLTLAEVSAATASLLPPPHRQTATVYRL